MRRRRLPEGSYMQVLSGQALRRRRGDRSLREVAELMGRPTSWSFIARLEKELVRSCTPEFARSLAAVLGRDVDELFLPRVPTAGAQDVSRQRTRTVA